MIKLAMNFPSSFFKEEVRCNYTVSSKMKQVWAIELDLANHLLCVCKQNNLRIYAIGGTLLGAVRHAGFIPWDDDIDFAMPRADYERLCLIAKSEFEAPIFFQTEYSDRGSLRGHAQLRNSNTTGILMSERNIATFNQGIFIDIFPIDNLPDVKYKKKIFLNIIKILKVICSLVVDNNIRKKPIFKFKSAKSFLRPFIYYFTKYTGYLFNDYIFVYKFFEFCSSIYNKSNTLKCGLVSFNPSNNMLGWERKFFEKVIWKKFENIEVPIPTAYEEILHQSYGNWHEFVREKSMHGEVLFDTENSFKKYL